MASRRAREKCRCRWFVWSKAPGPSRPPRTRCRLGARTRPGDRVHVRPEWKRATQAQAHITLTCAELTLGRADSRGRIENPTRMEGWPASCFCCFLWSTRVDLEACRGFYPLPSFGFTTVTAGVQVQGFVSLAQHKLHSFFVREKHAAIGIRGQALDRPAS